MPSDSESRTWKRWAYRLATVIFVLSVITATITIWANLRIQDSDAWAETVAPMASNPDVQAFIVDRSMEAINRQIDEDGNSGRLPRAFNLLQPLIQPALTEVVDSDMFADWWTNANVFAHQTLVTTVQGDSADVVSIDTNAIVLNLQPLLDRVNNQIESRVPGVSYSIELSNQQASIEILHSDAIPTIVRSFGWIDRLSVILPLLAIVSLGTAMLVANDRIRGLRNLLISLGITSTVVIAALYLFRFFFVARQPEADQAMYGAMLGIILADLTIALAVVAGVGIVSGICTALLGWRKISSRTNI